MNAGVALMKDNGRTWWIIAGTIGLLLVVAMAYRFSYSGPAPVVPSVDQPPPSPNPPVTVEPEPASSPSPTRPELNAALFDRLQYGMTKADVKAILLSDPDMTNTEYVPAGEFTEPRRIFWMVWNDMDKNRRLRLGFVNGKLEEKALELIEQEAP